MPFLCIKNTLQSSTDCYCLYSLLTSRIGSGGWSTEGVTTVQVTQEGNNTVVQCNSTHLTSFAVLVNVAGSRAVVSAFCNVLLMNTALSLLNLYTFVHTNIGRVRSKSQQL